MIWHTKEILKIYILVEVDEYSKTLNFIMYKREKWVERCEILKSKNSIDNIFT